MSSRYTPQPGDIGLVGITSGAGRLIRVMQWMNGDGYYKYVHAFVVASEYGMASDQQLIVEAAPRGAVATNWLEEYGSHDIQWIICPDQYRQGVARAAISLVGTPYSFLDYGSLAAHRFHIPAPGLKWYIANTGHMICSQLADESARRGGWHLFEDGRWPGDVTPGDLYELVRTGKVASAT